MTAAPTESWGSGDAYERYVGRWSRQVAAELLRWLAVERGLAWADVGCGTGALSETILAACEPAAIEGVDASEGFVAGGRVAVYVWDYAGGMQMIRHFWDAAIAVNPDDAKLDQADRFPICQPEPLRALFAGAGLRSVLVRPIEIPTVFQDFDDYWNPFLGGQGSAPTYLASVRDGVRERIRAYLKARLAPAHGERIELTARAWAVQGVP
jgi:hypothetical protein